MTVQIQRRPFTADEYHKMAQAGILCQDDRVELLDGEIVEMVAESSAELDRQVKVPLYARAGVREVWLVDLTARLLEVYREPSPQGYRRAQQLRPGQRVAPLALGDVEIAAGEILG